MTDEDLAPDAWLDRIASVGALAPADAARALAATLGALGEHLTDEERNRVARALPVRFAALLGLPRQGVDADTFYDRVAVHEGTSPRFGREHAQTVGRVLAENLPPEVVAHLVRVLPPAVGELFRLPSDPGPPPDYAVGASERHHSLATGRVGSRHPLSEGVPPGAHTHSVAESNPHGATKISSARGMTQEREHESLASDTPDESRTIANAKD